MAAGARVTAESGVNVRLVGCRGLDGGLEAEGARCEQS